MVKDLRQSCQSNLSLDAAQALMEAALALANVARGLGAEVPEKPLSAGLFSLSSPSTVRETVDRFLEAKRLLGRSPGHLNHLQVTLRAFSRGAMGRKPIADITVDEVEAWLRRHGWQIRTQHGKLIDIRNFFSWALKRDLVKRNPAAAIELPRREEPPPAIHSPDQVAACLNAARYHDLNLCRCLAVRYFAGLRTIEANRLEESEILLDRGWIEVKAQKSKTRRRRLVRIQPALAAWLALEGVLPLHDPKHQACRVHASFGHPVAS